MKIVQNPEVDDSTLTRELHALVDEGLLHMGTNVLGEIVFWPTRVGIEILGMLG